LKQSQFVPVSVTEMASVELLLNFHCGRLFIKRQISQWRCWQWCALF